MKYIVVPAEVLINITQDTLDEMHLVFRYSVDGTEVIMKVANYELLFPSAMTLPLTEEDETPEVVYPYPTYEGDALNTLLQSSEWTSQDNSVLGESILESPTVKTTSSKTRKSTKNTVL